MSGTLDCPPCASRCSMTRRRSASRTLGRPPLKGASAYPACQSASRMRRPCGNPCPCALARWPRAGDTGPQRHSPVVSQRSATPERSRRMPIRWVLVRRYDQPPRAFLSTCPDDQVADIVSRFSAGASRRPRIKSGAGCSRKTVPIWASKRSVNGRTWRPSGPRRVCWACIPT